MSIFAVFALINAVASFFFGLLVIFKKRTSENIHFFLFAFSTVFWSLAYFMWQIATTGQGAIFWSKLLTIGSIMIPVLYFRFVSIFLGVGKKKPNKISFFIGLFLIVFFVLISPTSLLVDGVSEKMGFTFWPNAGKLYWLFLLTFFFFLFYFTVLLIKHYRKITGIKKAQIKFLLIGILISFTGGSTNFFLWYDLPVKPYGNAIVSTYVIFTAYAIIRYRLMNIKFVIRRWGVYLASVGSVIAVVFVLIILFEK